ncbi:MAG: methyltransferase domain-containing protein [Candidatus Altiarchaeota archaeon]|nr:methyltransferase domain-containing protein [Candidatus Altiarchaeota archaeon]
MIINKDCWENKHSKRIDTMKEPNKFAEQVLDHTKSGKLLDLGCGLGADAIFFAETGFEVTALDFSKTGLEALKSRKGALAIEMIEADLKDDLSEFKDSGFDIVYSRLSLQYFSHDETSKIFSEIKRILKPAGWFFFMVKSTSDPEYGKGEKLENDVFVLDGYFQHFFSKKKILSNMTGFEMVLMEETKGELTTNHETVAWKIVAKKL